jgi:hypothetical protein
MSVMRLTAKILRYAAFVIMMLFGVVGGLFVAGYAFEDLDTWAAVGSTLAWLVPTLALCALAVWRPDVAAPVLLGVAVVAAVFTVLDATLEIIDLDAVGPVTAIAVFATAVGLAVLGLHREALSGLLLVLLAVAQFLATVLSHPAAAGDEGPGLGDLLTTSSGVVVVPMAMAGLLFLVAGALDHEPPGLRHLPPTTRAAH